MREFVVQAVWSSLLWLAAVVFLLGAVPCGSACAVSVRGEMLCAPSCE